MTFKTFAVASCNQSAYDICLNFAKTPDKHKNPFFIYSHVGNGKTHLTHAIINYILDNKIFCRDEICNMTGDIFFSNFRENGYQELRDYYCSKKMFIMDGITYLENKSIAQKERSIVQTELINLSYFFHSNNKAMIFTCYSHPRDLEGFVDILESWLEWGGIAEIKPPDNETRILILNMLAQREHIDLPDEAAQFIASKETDHVRPLEAFLITLDAFASVKNTPITLALAEEWYYKHFTVKKR